VEGVCRQTVMIGESAIIKRGPLQKERHSEILVVTSNTMRLEYTTSLSPGTRVEGWVLLLNGWKEITRGSGSGGRRGLDEDVKKGRHQGRGERFTGTKKRAGGKKGEEGSRLRKP